MSMIDPKIRVAVVFGGRNTEHAVFSKGAPEALAVAGGERRGQSTLDATARDRLGPPVFVKPAHPSTRPSRAAAD